MDLVAIPNVRTDLPNIKRNAEQLRQMLDRRGMKPEVWDTPSTPLVYGERLVPGATQTILFYIHFDGQPVDKARWKQPDPFRPVLRAGSLEEGAAGNPSTVAGRASVSRRLAHLRAVRRRRQGTDSGIRVGDGRDRRQADEQHQSDPARRGRRRRPGARLRREEPRRQAALRRADHRRRPAAPERQADGLLRRARRRGPRRDGLHGEERDAQRQLRQLAARRERAAVAAAGVDGRSLRQGRRSTASTTMCCRSRRPR